MSLSRPPLCQLPWPLPHWDPSSVGTVVAIVVTMVLSILVAMTFVVHEYLEMACSGGTGEVVLGFSFGEPHDGGLDLPD